RLAVAIKTPGHLQSVGGPGERHLRDLSVAGGAADSLVHVDAVVETDEVGQRVHARPGERLIVAVAGPHRFEHGAIDPDLRMAGHAGGGGRQPGERGLLDRRVAVAAIEPELADVMLVAERYRLWAGHIHVGDVGRLADPV